MEILERWNIKLSDMQLDKTDPRVRNWFLMHSPKPTYMILISYILFVKVNINSEHKAINYKPSFYQSDNWSKTNARSKAI